MDTINLKASSGNMFVFRTISTKTWSLRSDYFGFGNSKLVEEAELRFEPQLPYMYLPNNYFNLFVLNINQHYKDLGYKVCDTASNLCKFESRCEMVRRATLSF